MPGLPTALPPPAAAGRGTSQEQNSPWLGTHSPPEEPLLQQTLTPVPTQHRPQASTILKPAASCPLRKGTTGRRWWDPLPLRETVPKDVSPNSQRMSQLSHSGPRFPLFLWEGRRQQLPLGSVLAPRCSAAKAPSSRARGQSPPAAQSSRASPLPRLASVAWRGAAPSCPARTASSYTCPVQPRALRSPPGQGTGMCFEVLVHNVIPCQQWPQKPPPLGPSRGAGWLRVPNLGSATPDRAARGDSRPVRGRSPAWWQRGRIRRGTGMGADPAGSPRHLPSSRRAQEGPQSPAAAREKQEDPR